MNGLLYALAQSWLGVLPVNEAGRRVFDETLADWRREAAKATGPAASVLVSVRAIFAVLRSVAGVSIREITSIHQSGVVKRTCLLVAAYLATISVVGYFRPSPWEISWLSTAYAQVPAAAFFLPVALLLAATFAGTRRHLPALGLSLAQIVTGSVLLGWAVPVANRAFLEANPSPAISPPSEFDGVVRSRPGDGLQMAMGTWSRVGSYSPTTSFTNDLTVVELSRKIGGGPESGGWSAIRWMSFFFAYVATCALIPVLAAILRRRTLVIRLSLVGVTVALLWTQGGISAPFGGFSIAWWLGAYWLPVLWMSLCVVGAAGVQRARQAVAR